MVVKLSNENTIKEVEGREMADSREEFLVELYTGINVVLSDDFTQVPYDEFKARMQTTSTDEIRKQVLELRKIVKTNK